MNTHDSVDRITGFNSMVERNPARMVMQNVCRDSAVEEVLINYAELAIHS
jgi:hypothetical protein